MKTKHTPEETPMITVNIPDYDTRFTYSLKMGDLCAFDDGNRLELADRAQLTDLVSVVNAHLMRFNILKRENDELLSALKKISAHYDDLGTSNPGFMSKLFLQDYALWNDALISMRSALSKAKGTP